MPKKKTFNLVAVLWKDANIHNDEDAPLPLPVPALTLGLLLEDTPDCVTIASELFADGDMRQKQTIPRGMVIRVIPLRKLQLPVLFIDYPLRERLLSNHGQRPKWPGYGLCD